MYKYNYHKYIMVVENKLFLFFLAPLRANGSMYLYHIDESDLLLPTSASTRCSYDFVAVQYSPLRSQYQPISSPKSLLRPRLDAVLLYAPARLFEAKPVIYKRPSPYKRLYSSMNRVKSVQPRTRRRYDISLLLLHPLCPLSINGTLSLI